MCNKGMLDNKYVPCHFKGTEFPPSSQCFKKRQLPSMPFNIFLYDFDGLNIKYYQRGSCIFLSTLLSAYIYISFSNHWMYCDVILYCGVKKVRNGFIWLKIRIQSWTPVNLVINFNTASNVRNFLTTWGSNSSSRTLLQLLVEVIKVLFRVS